MKNPVRYDKEHNGYVAWKLNQEGLAVCVDIIEIYEYPERRYPRYRVDFRGKTIFSMITLTEAKEKARMLLSGIK